MSLPADPSETPSPTPESVPPEPGSAEASASETGTARVSLAAGSPTRAVRAAAAAGDIPQGDAPHALGGSGTAASAADTDTDTGAGAGADSTATAHALPAGHPEMTALDGGNPDDTRPWMLCIVDHDDARALAEQLQPVVAERLRLMICSTVMQGLKHLQVVLQRGDTVAVVMSEEPLAGMTGGGMWGLQKCRALVPNSLRLLGVQAGASLLSVGLRKLKDADIHQVFDLGTDPTVVAKRLILPLLDNPDDAVDETLRSATIRARSDVRLLTIPKETFADLLHRDAHLSIGITRELARRLRRQQQK